MSPKWALNQVLKGCNKFQRTLGEFIAFHWVEFTVWNSSIGYNFESKSCSSPLRVATPLWPSVGVTPNTSKVGDLESSGTLECLELDSKAQNTLHWGVLGVIGKVLKLRWRKWPRLGHLDICNPSYGQKKGRESNCQFDSRPQNVGNRPFSDLRIESAIRCWKDLDEGYKFGLDLIAIRLCSRELWAPKVLGL
jgi:hypothetical protein